MSHVTLTRLDINVEHRATSFTIPFYNLLPFIDELLQSMSVVPSIVPLTSLTASGDARSFEGAWEKLSS